MQCPTCDYENPRAATVCVDCGAGLGRTAQRKAEGHFLRDLDSARGKAIRRLKRAGVQLSSQAPGHGGERDGGS